MCMFFHLVLWVARCWVHGGGGIGERVCGERRGGGGGTVEK